MRERPAMHLPEQAAGFVLAASVATLTGPFQTDEMPLGPRAVYWIVTIGLPWALIVGLIVLLGRLAPSRDWPPLRRVVTAMALAAAPTAALVWAVDGWMTGDTGGAPTWAMLLNVAVLFAVIGGLVLARLRPRLVAPGPLPARNAFLDRLPPKLGTALISLTAQDHYVEVVTAKGRELIHMRFADALEELGGYPGQQIHRSHWISAHAYAGIATENGRAVAHLLDGRSLPVSRRFAPEVRRMQPVRPMPAG